MTVQEFVKAARRDGWDIDEIGLPQEVFFDGFGWMGSYDDEYRRVQWRERRAIGRAWMSMKAKADEAIAKLQELKGMPV